ncbi:hypothetical protein L1887_50203 [Cichorium endivia]|nr:hypothetical protein L1887_50203 [Cichorium endivia]
MSYQEPWRASLLCRSVSAVEDRLDLIDRRNARWLLYAASSGVLAPSGECLQQRPPGLEKVVPPTASVGFDTKLANRCHECRHVALRVRGWRQGMIRALAIEAARAQGSSGRENTLGPDDAGPERTWCRLCRMQAQPCRRLQSKSRAPHRLVSSLHSGVLAPLCLRVAIDECDPTSIDERSYVCMADGQRLILLKRARCRLCMAQPHIVEGLEHLDGDEQICRWAFVGMLIHDVQLETGCCVHVIDLDGLDEGSVVFKINSARLLVCTTRCSINSCDCKPATWTGDDVSSRERSDCMCVCSCLVSNTNIRTSSSLKPIVSMHQRRREGTGKKGLLVRLDSVQVQTRLGFGHELERRIAQHGCESWWGMVVKVLLGFGFFFGSTCCATRPILAGAHRAGVKHKRSTIKLALASQKAAWVLVRCARSTGRAHVLRSSTPSHALRQIRPDCLFDVAYPPWYRSNKHRTRRHTLSPAAALASSPIHPIAQHVHAHNHRQRFKKTNHSGPTSLGLGETNSVPAEIIHRVVLPEEDVADDEHVGERAGEVDAREGRDARALHLEHIVLALQLERLAVNVERQRRQILDLFAVHRVLAVPRLCGADLGVEDLGRVGGHGDERGARVDGGRAVVQLELLVAQRELVQRHLPVALALDGRPVDLARVVRVVDAAKHRLAAVGLRGAEVERHLGRVEQALVDHLVHRRYDAVDRDRVVGQAEDAVKLAKGERQAGLAGGLGEVLALDGEVADLEHVVRDNALHGARAVLDLELGAVLLVARRGGAVVLLVEEAGDGGALGGGHPEVRGARVEDHLELLGGGAERNVAKVLGVEEVGERHAVALLGFGIPRRGRVLGRDGLDAKVVLRVGGEGRLLLGGTAAVLELEHLGLGSKALEGELARGRHLLQLGLVHARLDAGKGGGECGDKPVGRFDAAGFSLGLASEQQLGGVALSLCMQSHPLAAYAAPSPRAKGGGQAATIPCLPGSAEPESQKGVPAQRHFGPFVEPHWEWSAAGDQSRLSRARRCPSPTAQFGFGFGLDFAAPVEWTDGRASSARLSARVSLDREQAHVERRRCAAAPLNLHRLAQPIEPGAPS